MLSNSTHRVNFRGGNREDEYIYVPLIWGDDDYDSVEFSNPQNPRDTQRQNAGNSQNQPNANQGTSSGTPLTPVNDANQGPRFKKFATRVAGTVGTVTLVPTGIEQVAKGVERSVVSTKDSINNTIDSIAEIKEHTKAAFHKQTSNQPETHATADNTIPHQETILAGETPVQDHKDFDRIHEGEQHNTNITDDTIIDDENTHQHDDEHQDNGLESELYEG